jgi:HK97 gp10 family phage protein
VTKKNTTFKVEGLEEIIAKLKELETKIAKKIIRKALRKGASILTKATKQRAPVGETGNLKAGIKTKAGKRSRKTISINVVLSDSTVKGAAYYAAFQEFGTFNKDETPRIEGKGFMREAFDVEGPTASKAVIDTFWDEIKKVAEKQGSAK